MRIHNLYEDENGESHFRDIEIEWSEERNFSKYWLACRPTESYFERRPAITTSIGIPASAVNTSSTWMPV